MQVFNQRNDNSLDVAPLKLVSNVIRNLLIKMTVDDFTKLMQQHKEIRKL